MARTRPRSPDSEVWPILLPWPQLLGSSGCPKETSELRHGMGTLGFPALGVNC